jgi:hypothetical protein
MPSTEFLSRSRSSCPMPSETDSDISARSGVSAISRHSRGCQYIPRSYWIDPATVTPPTEAYTFRTCTQVYRGTRNGDPVTVKVLRTSNQESATSSMKVSTGCGQEARYLDMGRLDETRRFSNEAIVWKHMSCPYALKFNGLYYCSGVLTIVTPWMPRGEHHRTSGERRRCGSVTSGKLGCSTGTQH